MTSGGERTRRSEHGVGPRASLTDARMTPIRPECEPKGLATWPEQPVCPCQVRVARCPHEEAALRSAGLGDSGRRGNAGEPQVRRPLTELKYFGPGYSAWRNTPALCCLNRGE